MTEEKPTKEYRGAERPNFSGNDFGAVSNCGRDGCGTAPFRLTRGVLGAVLGTLVGIVFCTMIFQYRYNAGIGGFVLAALGVKGMQLFGGKPHAAVFAGAGISYEAGRTGTKNLYGAGFAAAGLIAAAGLVIANRTAWGLEAYLSLRDYGWTLPGCLQNVKYIIEQSGIELSFAATLLRSVCFGIIAFAGAVIDAKYPPEKPADNAELYAPEGGTGGLDMSTAYFASGCFWCITPEFAAAAGVSSVRSGYSGGDEENPAYEAVKHQQTGHRETVKVEYDPAQISYAELLQIFLTHVDPFDGGGQFIDRGHSYTLAVYYTSEEERAAARAALDELAARTGREPQVALEPFKSFWDAEEYHQDYYKKNPEAFRKELEESGRLERFGEGGVHSGTPEAASEDEVIVV